MVSLLNIILNHSLYCSALLAFLNSTWIFASQITCWDNSLFAVSCPIYAYTAAAIHIYGLPRLCNICFRISFNECIDNSSHFFKIKTFTSLRTGVWNNMLELVVHDDGYKSFIGLTCMSKATGELRIDALDYTRQRRMRQSVLYRLRDSFADGKQNA